MLTEDWFKQNEFKEVDYLNHAFYYNKKLKLSIKFDAGTDTNHPIGYRIKIKNDNGMSEIFMKYIDSGRLEKLYEIISNKNIKFKIRSCRLLNCSF